MKKITGLVAFMLLLNSCATNKSVKAKKGDSSHHVPPHALWHPTQFQHH